MERKPNLQFVEPLRKTLKQLSRNKKNDLTLFAFFLILIALPMTIFILQKQQQTQEQAAGTNALYVSTSGNDSNPGTQVSPFATLNKAASVATAGTTVHVLPGTYNEAFSNSQSGTATAPITFISDTKWRAKIVSGSKLIFDNSGDYVHIIGFDISSSGGVSVALEITGSHDLIQGNHVHNMGGITCSGTPGGAGISDDSPGSDNTFDGNMINNIGDYPTACDYIHALYIDDAGDVVENNISYNNTGNGFYVNHETGSVTFINNLAFANAEYGIGINGTQAVSGFVIANNISMGNGLAGFKTWGVITGAQYINNIVFNNPTNFIQDGAGTDQGTITADPQFVNYQANGSGDYHLKATSPAIDAGISTNVPNHDYDGHPRPQGKGYDIGPYEFTPERHPWILSP